MTRNSSSKYVEQFAQHCFENNEHSCGTGRGVVWGHHTSGLIIDSEIRKKHRDTSGSPSDKFGSPLIWRFQRRPGEMHTHTPDGWSTRWISPGVSVARGNKNTPLSGIREQQNPNKNAIWSYKVYNSGKEVVHINTIHFKLKQVRNVIIFGSLACIAFGLYTF